MSLLWERIEKMRAAAGDAADRVHGITNPRAYLYELALVAGIDPMKALDPSVSDSDLFDE